MSTVPGFNNTWFEYTQRQREQHQWARDTDTQAAVYQNKLANALATYTNVNFDHIKIGYLGRRICVFVATGSQSIVLYDKTKGFPSAKLLASLTLLGSK